MLTIESINTILEDKDIKITVYSKVYKQQADHYQITETLKEEKNIYFAMDPMTTNPTEMENQLFFVQHLEDLLEAYEAIAIQTYENMFRSTIQFPCNFQNPEYDLVAA